MVFSKTFRSSRFALQSWSISQFLNLDRYRHGWRKLAAHKRHPQSDIAERKRNGGKLPQRLCQLRALGSNQVPIKLMFQDKARFGRINDVRRCWAPKPVRPLCQAMLTHEYTYAYVAVGCADRAA